MTDARTSPEAVERLIERLHIAYCGPLVRYTSATLRAISAERDALKAENARLQAAEDEARAALAALEQGGLP